jgi:hypothetical protein
VEDEHPTNFPIGATGRSPGLNSLAWSSTRQLRLPFGSEPNFDERTRFVVIGTTVKTAFGGGSGDIQKGRGD